MHYYLCQVAITSCFVFCDRGLGGHVVVSSVCVGCSMASLPACQTRSAVIIVSIPLLGLSLILVCDVSRREMCSECNHRIKITECTNLDHRRRQ